MARIRTIKPAFFRNHKLYTREAEANAQRQPGEPYLPIRVAFAALFTVADRAGRFVWREHELKLDCLPYDPVDMGRILTVLQSEPDPYIIGYEVDGKRYGYIPEFLTHQRPKADEAASVIPPPPASPLLVPKESSQTTVGVRSESNRRKGIWKGNREKNTTPRPSAPAKPEAQAISEPDKPKTKTAIQGIVTAYKLAKGYAKDDAGWDKANFARAAKAAENLLDAFGCTDKGALNESNKPSAMAAADFLSAKADDLNAAGLTWTLETMAKLAWDRGNDDGRNGDAVGGNDSVDERRGKRTAPTGKLAGAALDAIRNQMQDRQGRDRVPGDDGSSQSFDEPFLESQDGPSDAEAAP